MTGVVARSWVGAGIAVGARPRVAADESDSIGKKGDDRERMDSIRLGLHDG